MIAVFFPPTTNLRCDIEYDVLCTTMESAALGREFMYMIACDMYVISVLGS